MTATPQIIIKNDIDHIRLRPGMYIGSTYDPNHLAQEIIDNSLDEVINKFATELRVNFISDSHVVVTDNGRGIPVHMVDIENGIQELSIKAAATRLKSGAKFDHDAYDVSIGLHGIGLVAVNALSKSLRISVQDKTTQVMHDMIFDHSEMVSYQTYAYDPKLNWSTRVEFEVDPQYFTIGTFNRNRFIDQFKLTSTKYSNVSLFIDDVLINAGTLVSYVQEKLEIDPTLPIFQIPLKSTLPIKTFDPTSKQTRMVDAKIEFDIFFTYDFEGATATKTNGDVNLRNCGGRYLTNFCTIFANAVIEKYPALTKNDALSNFRVYISSIVPNPEFDSQSKVNMSNDYRAILEKIKPIIINKLNDPYIKECINALVERKTSKKISKKAIKKKTRVSSKNPLKDCLSVPGKTLWLLEGESATGNLMRLRNHINEGVFPLTGKISNVVNKTMDQVADSKKYKFLFEAIGVEVGNKKQTSYRYEEIAILADADPDGHHIVVLVLMACWFYFPHFLHQRKIKIIIPPLYGATVNGQFIPIYSAAEAAKYTNCRRFKGIGEMNKDKLEVIIRGGGKIYIPQPPSTQAEADAIIRCLDDTEVKRRLCLERDKFNIERLFTDSKPLTI